MKTIKIIVATLMMGLLLNAAPTTPATACGTHHTTKAKTTSMRRTSLRKSSLRTSAMRTTLSNPQGIGMNANVGTTTTPGIGFNANAGANVGTLGLNGDLGAGINSSGLNTGAGINTPLGGVHAGVDLGSNLGVNAGVNTPIANANVGLGVGSTGMSFATSNGVGFSVPSNELGWRHVTPFWDLPVRSDTTGEYQDWSYLNRPDFYSYGTTGPVLQGNAYIGSPDGITPMAYSTVTVPTETRTSLTQRIGNGISHTYNSISNQVKRSTFELTHGGRTH